jgi:transposase
MSLHPFSPFWLSRRGKPFRANERVKFIAAYLRGEMSVSRLCEAFGVSRKTAYKWIARYAEGGGAELVGRSTRPHTNPNAMSREVGSLVVALRKEHPFWGPKKLLAILGMTYPGLKLPATSTVGHLLARHGMTRPRRPRRRSTPYGQPFLGYDKPNAVWCADFKGHFRLADRTRCHPMTISDGYSRYVLKCEALRHPRHDPTRAARELDLLRQRQGGVIRPRPETDSRPTEIARARVVGPHFDGADTDRDLNVRAEEAPPEPEGEVFESEPSKRDRRRPTVAVRRPKPTRTRRARPLNQVRRRPKAT